MKKEKTILGKYFDVSSSYDGGAAFYIYLDDVFGDGWSLTNTLSLY